MYKMLSLALVLATLGGGAVWATTSPVDPLLALQDFNAIIFGDATTPSDIEGAAIIGGNFSGATMYFNPEPTKLAGYGALTVFGNTSGNDINLNDGGSAYVGGTPGAHINFNGGGRYISAPPNTISAFQSSLSNFSTSLAALQPNSTTPATNNNEVFNAKPGANGVAVFYLTAAEFNDIPSFQVDLNGATSVIFDVSGTTITDYANDETNTSGANDIIWNFYQATSVNLQREIGGTVLAPLASVTNGNDIDGTLVAASWTGGGELHDVSYTGADPLPPSPAPEPSTWALMLAGVGVLGLMLRRARKTSRVDATDAVAAA